MAETGGVAGWVVGQSLAFELNVALMAALGAYPLGALPPEMAEISTDLPTGWRTELQDMLGKPRTSLAVLEVLATAAGTLTAREYSEATLPMRTLTAGAIAGRLAEQVGLPAADDLLQTGSRWAEAALRSAGFDAEAVRRQTARLRPDLEAITQIAAGGERHAGFWHWLDRFYYEVYGPWRRVCEGVLTQAEEAAGLALGGMSHPAAPPDLAWLPPQNPLLRLPELRAAVADGRLSVFFWAEPFGLADTWSLQPGLIIVAFGQPGRIFTNFHAYTQNLAGRAKALADPTCLVMLRLIRHFGMINTDIARYLDLAQPTVSVHAKILREAGLIESEPQGREMRHKIVPAEVRRLFRELDRFLDLPLEEDAWPAAGDDG